MLENNGLHHIQYSMEEIHITCSAKKCDNLLVEADIFYHLRGIILCIVKRLQFNHLKKEREGTVWKVFYEHTLSHFKFDVVVASVCVAQTFPHCDGSIIIFVGFWIKISYTN